MRILFCSQNPLDPKLGAPKALIELAGQFERLGWQCRLVSDEEVCPDIRRLGIGIRGTRAFSRSLAAFLERNARNFDVIDYDHTVLPDPRDRFSPSTLFVARVPLLVHHFEKIRIPRFKGIRPILGTLVKGPYRSLGFRLVVSRTNRTLAAADLINVGNDYDRAELVAQGFDKDKIVVLPLGLARERMEAFPSSPLVLPKPPRVVFVGTFDPRKGAREIPQIAGEIARAIPGCRFRLLGVRMSEERLLRHFPRELGRSLEVYPTFEPNDLPALLRDCSLGMFPSYIEGFGFGVLEMLAASLPVVAYDAPGPPTMLRSEYLVPRGNWSDMASRITALLRSPDRLAAARAWAGERALDFTWERSAQVTSTAYSEGYARLRAREVPRT